MSRFVFTLPPAPQGLNKNKTFRSIYIFLNYITRHSTDASTNLQAVSFIFEDFPESNKHYKFRYSDSSSLEEKIS
jgi:oligoribonuclease (3'-5' exoribonuclease)